MAKGNKTTNNMSVEEYILESYKKQETQLVAHFDNKIEQFKKDTKAKRSELVTNLQKDSIHA